MPLFVCDDCGCIDNTACGGTHWTKDSDLWPEGVRGKSLCSECAPTKFAGGTPHKRGGKWHGRFPKEKATPERIAEIGREHFVYIPEPTP